MAVTGSTQAVQRRLSAIRLRLVEPSPFLREQAQLLSNILIAKAPKQSGTLASAFKYFQIYGNQYGKGVKIGDPNILTQPTAAPKDTIKDFIIWLRKDNDRTKSKTTKQVIVPLEAESKRLGVRRATLKKKAGEIGRAKYKAQTEAYHAKFKKARAARTKTPLAHLREEFRHIISTEAVLSARHAPIHATRTLTLTALRGQIGTRKYISLAESMVKSMSPKKKSKFLNAFVIYGGGK